MTHDKNKQFKVDCDNVTIEKINVNIGAMILADILIFYFGAFEQVFYFEMSNRIQPSIESKPLRFENN